MSGQTNTQATTHSTLSQRIAVAAFGSVVGLFLIYGVGFAHPETIHNAAHDTRHAASFPCH